MYDDLLGNTPKVRIDLTNIRSMVNDSFYTLLTDKNRYLILKGGAGSGKSIFIAQKILLRVLVDMSRGIKHNILCLRKTFPSAKKSILPLFKHLIDEWNLGEICKLNKTDSIFHFRNGSQIMVSGLDDEEKIKSIFGLTSVWLEEANEFTKMDFEQLDLRLRGQSDTYYQIMFSFNPISKTSWIYDHFFDESNSNRVTENVTIHHSNYKDNRFLDEIYIKKLEAYINTSKYHYQVYALGEWGILEGVIYENWTLVDEMPSGAGGFACDFGYNNPMALVEVKKKEDDVFVHEWFYETKKTTQDLIRFIKRQLPERAIIVCDSAEPDRIQELKDAGIRAVAARKGKHSVLDGIDYMKRHKINITKSSVNIQKEITSYKWAEKNEALLDKPIEINDHAMDAIRYYCWSVYGKKEQDLKVVWV